MGDRLKQSDSTFKQKRGQSKTEFPLLPLFLIPSGSNHWSKKKCGGEEKKGEERKNEWGEGNPNFRMYSKCAGAQLWVEVFNLLFSSLLTVSALFLSQIQKRSTSQWEGFPFLFSLPVYLSFLLSLSALAFSCSAVSFGNLVDVASTYFSKSFL